MRIAIDAMGGDHAPAATVAGAVAAARDLGVGVLLIGDRTRIEAELAPQRTTGLDIELRHATEAIAMDESPTAALRRFDSSMYVGFKAVRDGEAAGFVFAGNTGAGMVLGAHVLGRCPGVDRPAIAVLLPHPGGHTVLLDAGANVDCRPLHLTQFAVMGDAYARAVKQIAAPRVGLLSNGLEDSKGNALVRSSAPLLRQLPLNFVGYVEGRDLNSGAVDVVVCDGFAGNIVLKSLEGFGRLVADNLRAMFGSRLRTRLAYLLVRRDMDAMRGHLDPGETGGGLLLGLNGIAVKAHGSSDARAIRNAVGVAADLARSDVIRQVAQGAAATIGLDGAVEPRRARRLWESIRERLRRDARGDAAHPADDAERAGEPAAAAAPPGASAADGHVASQPGASASDPTRPQRDGRGQ
ncbi:MAG TPA: phosphate acyltransferase PlsX [Candidatus Binatia bacterium]|nr:phosphate acyltransferase PlsX [Candidatus Binatia bacterium]